ncbi:hypothetical protein RN22_24360 [Grimontia sp. AD028]|nr:hypothetical protein RN22_24360 [Grimontia sp. AD028]
MAPLFWLLSLPGSLKLKRGDKRMISLKDKMEIMQAFGTTKKWLIALRYHILDGLVTIISFLP